MAGTSFYYFFFLQFSMMQIILYSDTMLDFPTCPSSCNLIGQWFKKKKKKSSWCNNAFLGSFTKCCTVMKKKKGDGEHFCVDRIVCGIRSHVTGYVSCDRICVMWLVRVTWSVVCEDLEERSLFYWLAQAVLWLAEDPGRQICDEICDDRFVQCY